MIISMKNLHKTYLLGVEGVPALRYSNSFISNYSFNYTLYIFNNLNDRYNKLYLFELMNITT